MSRKRAVSVSELVGTRFKTILLPISWQNFIGIPEANGVWFVWGHSGHGKSRFLIQLALVLTNYGKVAFNELEEGARLSFKNNLIESGFADDPKAKKNFIILDREPIEELKVRLRKKQAPKIVFINSFQHAGLNRQQYLKLKEEFTDTLFIINSHAEGKEPKGQTAQFVRYDADVKIRVEGFKAFPASRFGGGQEHIIWDEGAKNYWIDIK